MSANAKIEYVTTWGWSLSGEPVNPQPPDGDGWRMCGAAAAAMKAAPGKDGVQLFWFWQRSAPATKPCQCGAMARKDDRCLGCGAPV